MNYKLYISTQFYDAMMTMQYTTSLLRLISLLNRRNIDFIIDFIGNESLIPRARNTSLGKFMQTDCTHLLFIDSDIEFPENAVFDLLQYDKDVTCCCYPTKGFNWNKLLYSIHHNKESKETLESRGLNFAYNPYYNNNNVIQKGNYIKVQHAATGFMLIKRDILEKLHNKHKELTIKTNALSDKDHIICGLFCCMIKDKTYLSEDYAFCERVNDIGGSIWLNIHHNLNHIGKYSFNSDINNRADYGRSQSERIFYST